MSFSPVLALYRGATATLGLFAGAYLDSRARRGKEDPARLGERFGRYARARPAGPLVWLHGASVGESGVALQLIEALAARDASLCFLLTTGTRTSADLVARRAPPRTTHVYAPLDRSDCVRRFLTHWRPDLGVFVESELWPNLILEAQAAGVKLALVNARMSPKTLARWRGWRAAGERLTRAFSVATAADARTSDTLSALRGVSTPALGNLKLAAPAPRVDARARAGLAAQIGARPLWLAASTHAGEDAIVLQAHEILRQSFPDPLLIIVPRHPERGPDISQLAGGAPMRSRSETLAGPCYVADTMGEMGLFYDLAPVALVAGSLAPHLKGHNPVEPAKLNAAIVTGPYVESFQDLFDALFAAGGARKVTDAASLAAAVADLLRDDARRVAQIARAREVADQGAGALDETVRQLATLLPARATPKAADASA
ncbi:3-deoxy-D-manno-octulosonic acid transferase [Terricaulis sp.]|uniref:3-deoxy-D-manno-octulosonic acid transferase n=1 Tax=Terricaulis sp. TaxID=2768686 RepID=UPI0037847497